jgi:hypothetical protein
MEGVRNGTSGDEKTLLELMRDSLREDNGGEWSDRYAGRLKFYNRAMKLPRISWKKQRGREERNIQCFI